MNDIENLFKPAIGELMWDAKRGHGSWMSISFGRPHLKIIEIKRKNTSALKTNRPPRRVFVTGEWSILVMASHWSVATAEQSCIEDDPRDTVDTLLEIFNGQKLISVIFDTQKRSLVLQGDLGTTLTLYGARDDSVDSLWSFTDSTEGCMTVYKINGEIETFKTRAFAPGSIGVWSDKASSGN